ncbi:MAG: DNA-processing protein DprA [Clostridiales Family XIII bacterium]|jgi:DNA processing protein|nr:DNA-processing protein DprA [Clostridiales Family XIII bacterium]
MNMQNSAPGGEARYGEAISGEQYGSLGIEDSGYPKALRGIADPPPRLYYMGKLAALENPMVAIVGARRATDYGRWAAYNLAHRLSERGVAVVSGMAEGIDSFAHKGALEGPTPTIAVMGNGLDICFPKSNLALRERIARSGLLLSEYSEGTHGTRFTYPARNRIISGLSIATVVVEAGLSSGSLITAEYAAAQGREVYAVPGNINRKLSVGCNKLIKDGVLPLVFLDDILDDLGLRTKAKAVRRGKAGTVGMLVGEKRDPAPYDISCAAGMGELGADEVLVLGAVCEHGEMTVDDAAMLAKLSVPTVTCAVTLLEMKGYVHFDGGRIMVAN